MTYAMPPDGLFTSLSASMFSWQGRAESVLTEAFGGICL
jgi:hypothetical protein